jgi:tetratricopeptide (TPR) repeat protein
VDPPPGTPKMAIKTPSEVDIDEAHLNRSNWFYRGTPAGSPSDPSTTDVHASLPAGLLKKELAMKVRFIAFVLTAGVLWSLPLRSQSEQQKRKLEGSPAIPADNRVNPSMSASDLENRADQLRAAKEYVDAYDFYRAALAKNPNSAVLYNKLGINELMSLHLRQAKSDFERALHLDRQLASAYNNLGVLEYALKKYRASIKDYEKAIRLDENATYYSNLGAAYFSKKNFPKATEAYRKAVQIDPGVFDNASRVGISGQIASPEDRAHFSYVLAELYAKQGLTDRSLECLRRALEEGYKHADDAFSDAAFAQLRKDPRFVALMSKRPPAISD